MKHLLVQVDGIAGRTGQCLEGCQPLPLQEQGYGSHLLLSQIS